MVHPREEEESTRVVESVSGCCEDEDCFKKVVKDREGESEGQLTFRDRDHSSPLGQLVRSNNSHKDGYSSDAKPPANKVTRQVDLLLQSLRSGPETDPAEEERPADGRSGVGVRVGETSVVL